MVAAKIDTPGWQRVCLWLGVAAPLLFAGVFTLDGALQPGYSAFQEAISYLDLGPHAWVQRANFSLFGLLLIAFAAGCARQLGPVVGRGWATAGAAGLTLSGVGWIMAGVFVPNPYGTAQDSPHAVMHTVAFETVFLPYAAACLLLGVGLARARGWRVLGVYSLLNGLLMGVVPVVGLYYFVDPRAFNTDSPGGGLTNRLALVVAFAWYLILATRLLRAAPAHGGSAGRH